MRRLRGRNRPRRRYLVPTLVGPELVFPGPSGASNARGRGRRHAWGGVEEEVSGGGYPRDPSVLLPPGVESLEGI